MEVKIKETTLGNILEVSLKQGEHIFAETGALVSSTGEVHVESKIGGIVSGMLRGFGGESLFINKIQALENSTIELSPSLPSEIVEVDLNGSMILGDGVYLAHTGDIDISAKFGGLTSLLSGSGLMFSKASGSGKLYLAAVDSLHVKELKEGEVFYLDNSSFVACKEGVKIEKFLMGKGLLSRVVGGEGFFFKFTGPAKIYYSVSSARSFASAILRFYSGR